MHCIVKERNGLSQGITNQFLSVQIFLVQLHCRNAVIVIGLIIVNPLLQIAAGAVYGNLIFSLAQIAASSLLLHCTENMEKLADTLFLALCGTRV